MALYLTKCFNRGYLVWTFRRPFQHSRNLANGAHGKTSESRGCQLSVSFPYCEVTSVIRNDIVWDTKTVYYVHTWRFWQRPVEQICIQSKCLF